MRYVELQVTSNYSFLRGASQVEELFAQAHEMGMEILAITDRNSLAGIARAHHRAHEIGMRLIVGCRLDLNDAPSLLVYPTDRAAYGRLCRLLSIGKGRAGKGRCDLSWSDLAEWSDGLLAILIPPIDIPRIDIPQAGVPDVDITALTQDLGRLRDLFGDRGYCALTLQRRPNDHARLARITELAHAARVAPAVTGDVLYHHRQRRILQDVVTCIREGCTIDQAGFRRERSVDRHLRSPGETCRLYETHHAAALAASVELAGRCRFSLDMLAYQYPEESETPGLDDQQDLERLVRERIPVRYPRGVPEAVATQLGHELALVAQLKYAPYFLTVNAIVRFARESGILCQGRGSAANSAVCYVLGITAIDPAQGNLLFERFISADRNEPPDIDVDFEHERREEVIQWIYARYGRERAALCAAIARYHSRGALRDVGKVMGLPEDVTGALASQVWGWSEDGVDEDHARALNLNLDDRRLRLTLSLARELIGFPRHASQHPGGFVLTRDRLDTLVPIEPAAMADRQIIEWDKDDIDALKFMKVDVLGLGMLGCMRRAFDLLEQHRGERHDLASIPDDDPDTFAMIRKADTLGTFQIESRAQMAMLPRLAPREFYDLVIQVAIVRPGPIQGDMVHPYLRRREELEKPEYLKPELERVLKKTLGVPLFQEQAMQVAIQCADFTPSEADQLRRSMATFKMTGGVSRFRDKLIRGMVANGYPEEFAARTFKQIEGFGSYGFPESHAAGFARIAYVSAWMKCHHPDIFAAALLNAQPMGFYAPAQVVRDAREHGVAVRAACINASAWDCTLEDCTLEDCTLEDRTPEVGGGALALRLGLRMVRGLSAQDADRLVAARATHGRFASIEILQRRASLPRAALEQLAASDAFQDIGLSRRAALWRVRGLDAAPMPLFAARHDVQREPAVELAALSEGGEVVADYRATGLTLRRHPLALLRPALSRRMILPCDSLDTARDGRSVAVAGIVLVRQKPGSAKGVMFMTIEDETGIGNLVIWPSLFERQRRLILSAGMVACHGRVQRAGEVIHLVARELQDLTPLLHGLDRDAGPAPIQVPTRDFR